MSGCDSRQPHHSIHDLEFTIDDFKQAARQLAQSSLQNSTGVEQHHGGLPNRKSKIVNPSGVVADKQCTCPASKLMRERYPPTPPAFARCNAAGEGCRAEARGAKADKLVRTTGLRLGKPILLRETRPMHREKPHKLLQVGVTPTPAIFKWHVKSGKWHEKHTRSVPCLVTCHPSRVTSLGSDPAARL